MNGSEAKTDALGVRISFILYSKYIFNGPNVHSLLNVCDCLQFQTQSLIYSEIIKCIMSESLAASIQSFKFNLCAKLEYCIKYL